MKYNIKKKKKTFKVSYIMLILIVILILMSTSYSLWHTVLNIKSTVIKTYSEPALSIEIVHPEDNPDRLTTNTSLRGGLWNIAQVFDFVSDTYEGDNTVVTRLKNNQPTWLTRTVEISFSITLQNNSGYTYTNPTIQIDETGSNSRITPNSQNVNEILSSTVVDNGETVTLTAELTFISQSEVPVGSYINYKVGFICNGVRRYYNYKILISE